MCGRFTLYHSPEEVEERFGVSEALEEARYNIAPTQNVSVVTQNGTRHLASYHWGLIPSWAKDPAIGNKMINARAETLAEKPSFRTALSRRRCLIPADGRCAPARSLRPRPTPSPRPSTTECRSFCARKTKPTGWTMPSRTPATCFRCWSPTLMMQWKPTQFPAASMCRPKTTRRFSHRRYNPLTRRPAACHTYT